MNSQYHGATLSITLSKAAPRRIIQGPFLAVRTGHTQSEIAKAVRRSVHWVYAWERALRKGRPYPLSAELLPELAAAYGVTIDDLIAYVRQTRGIQPATQRQNPAASTEIHPVDPQGIRRPTCKAQECQLKPVGEPPTCHSVATPSETSTADPETIRRPTEDARGAN